MRDEIKAIREELNRIIRLGDCGSARTSLRALSIRLELLVEKLPPQNYGSIGYEDSLVDSIPPPEYYGKVWAKPDTAVRLFLQADNFINAIKHYRLQTGCGLKEAKDVIDY